MRRCCGHAGRCAASLAAEAIERLCGGEDLGGALAAAQHAFARVLAAADAREGIAAFVAKRAPRFSGR